MSRLTTSLKRVCAALMLCSSFPSALVHAQYVSFRIEAPQNIDYAAENYNDLMNEIGTLKITFSPSNMFQDVDNYARYNLDLSNDEFQYNSSSKNLKYKSYTLNAFPNGENGVCWGNQDITAFKVRELQRAFSLPRSWPIYYRVYSPHFNRIIIGKITPSDEERITIRHDEWAKSRRVVFNPVIGREGNVVSARLAPTYARALLVGHTGYATCTTYKRIAPLSFTLPWATPCATWWLLRRIISPSMLTLSK